MAFKYRVALAISGEVQKRLRLFGGGLVEQLVRDGGDPFTLDLVSDRSGELQPGGMSYVGNCLGSNHKVIWRSFSPDIGASC